MASSVASGVTGSTAGGLEMDPATELQFNLATSDTNPKVIMTLKHPGTNVTNESFAFKVKTTQPRRYLARRNQGLIAPGQSEEVQILLVEKDKKALLQSFQNLGQKTLDHAKDKFLVQSCQVTKAFANEYAASGEEAYDKLSSMWATVTSLSATTTAANSPAAPNTSPVINKKLHVRHVVQDEPGSLKGSMMPSSTAAAATSSLPVESMTTDQLTAELTNLRRKYDELVAFSVNLTAERDILNNTLEQTKRDLNRELNKKLPGGAGAASARSASASSAGRSSSKSSSTFFWLVTAFVFFALGVGMQVRGRAGFMAHVPVIGPQLMMTTSSSSSATGVKTKRSKTVKVDDSASSPSSSDNEL